MKNTCKRCGKEFEDRYKRTVCPGCRVQKCVICGKEFEVTANSPLAKCCSPKCRGEYAKLTGLSKKRTQKAKQTLQDKYGVDNPNVFQHEPKICEYCGKEFIPNSARQKYCEGPHYGPCPICGKLVEIKDMDKGPSTCSEECRLKLIQKTSLERYGASNVFASDYGKEKIKETMLERYGVESPLQSEQLKQKFTETMLEIYGVASPLQSQAIKDKVSSTNLKNLGVQWPTQNEQVKEKAAHTMLQRYGGIGIGSEETSKKIQASMLERHGVINPMQSEDIQQKVQQTNLKRYGVTNPMQHDSTKKKIKQTNLERYGATTSLLNEEVKEKARQANLERYGTDNIFKTEEGQKLARQGVRAKYGVDNVAAVPEIRHRIASTCKEKYGTTSWKSCPEGIQFAMLDPSKYPQYEEFLQNPEQFIADNFDCSPSIWELTQITGVTASTIGDRLKEANCQHLVTYKKSTMEQEVVRYLYEICPGIVLERCKRNLIAPYEVDIYLPEYKIGIECNPTYTHNSSFGTYYGDPPKDRKYHAMKSRMCEEVGVNLIHIFGYEWTNHKEVVKSRLCNMLGCNPYLYHARKLTLKEVPAKESKDFLNQNHMQGYTSSAVRLGLYDGKELISLMTFSKPRGSLGYSAQYGENTWELTRFCTKLYINCVGGASRLFTHFIREYAPSMVTSFSNDSNTTGKVYSILGFHKVGEVQPGYVWVSLKDDTYLSRVACQKQNLPKLFDEPDLDIHNQTEKQIMEAHGYARVWNSGLIKWEWTAENR